MTTLLQTTSLRASTALLVLLLFVTGCASTAQRSASTPQTTAQKALPESIRWVRAAAEHRALFLQVYAAAEARVREQAKGRTPGTWAVILDADETILDNSTYQMRRAAAGLGFTSETWDAWVREERATALPGATSFLNSVRDLGGRIAIVTNRDDAVCPETRRNIEALGLVTDIVLCRVNGLSDKNPRFEAVQGGTAWPGVGPLEVLAWIGDNIQDFPGLAQDIRDKPADAFAAFGRTYFLLPNPMYGSWERLPVVELSQEIAPQRGGGMLQIAQVLFDLGHER
jgi:5'-nucleotidase (lipoprotein e(P4) family)